MTQDKTLKEEFYEFVNPILYPRKYNKEIADFYEDKIKSVVREMRKKEIHYPPEEKGQEYKNANVYNKFGDDLLERLGIK